MAARIKNICRIFPKGLIMITLHKPLHVVRNWTFSGKGARTLQTIAEL